MVSYPPITAIVGPTGVGKTAAALRLAQRGNFELISADSRQVYRGMDIGTGKEINLGQWQDVEGWPALCINNILIHGLNLTTPDKPYSIANWHQHILTVINQVLQRQHQPLIVGGTGFYLQSLMGKVDTLAIPPHVGLRQQLQDQPASQLLQQLTQLNHRQAASLNSSDRHNPARLIRLIEVEYYRQNNPTSLSSASSPSIQLKLIGLTAHRDQLYAKADQRTDQMINQGLVEEVKQLINQYGANQSTFKTIGYAEIIQHLQGHLTIDQAIQSIKFHNHRYIRRQQTWFNKQSVEWLDIATDDWFDRLVTLMSD